MTVHEVSTRAMIDGREVHAISPTVSQELTGDMPESMASGGGWPQASGSMGVVVAPPVAEMGSSPFSGVGGIVPRRGQRVELWGDAGDGRGEQRFFTGIVDSSSGALGDEVQVKLIDQIDLLQSSVSVAGLISRMPPKLPGGEFMHPFPTAKHALFGAMRACGFHMVPPVPPGVLGEFLCQGAFWPSGATDAYTVAVRAKSDANRPPSVRAENGWDGMSDAYVDMRSLEHTPGRPLVLSCMVGRKHTEGADVTLTMGGGVASLVIAPDRSARVQIGGQVVAALSAAQMADALVVSARMTGQGVELVCDAGGRAVSSTPLPAGGVDRMEITASAGSSIAGVQLSEAPSGHPAIGWRPTAQIFPPWWMGLLQATPNIRKRSARGVIDEICKATLCAMWITSDGVMRIEGSDSLASKPARRTLSTRTEIAGLAWQDASRSTRRAVEIAYTPWTVTSSRVHELTVWQGDGEQLSAGRILERMIDIPASQLWLGVDTGMVRVDRPGTDVTPINAGVGSAYGVSLEQGGELVGDESAADLSMDYLGLWTYKFKATARKTCVQKAPNDSRFSASMRGASLPLLRAMGYAEQADSQYIRVEGGPSWAAELSHDMGPWGNELMATRLAEWLVPRAFDPHPLLPDFTVPVDYTLHVGDAVIVESMGLWGFTADCLIRAVTHSQAESTTTLSVQIRKITATRETWEAFDQVWGSRTWSAADATWAKTAPTYAALDAAPMKGF